MLLLLAALCGLLEAAFTSLEVGLGAVSRARLRALAEPDGDEAAPSPATTRRANELLALLERPERLSILFLCVTSLCLWCAASLLTWQVIVGRWSWPGFAGALVGLLFVAEVVPLLLAAPRAEAVALRGAAFVAFALRVLSPLTVPLGGLAFFLARRLGSGARATPHVTEGELRTALATAESEGTIEPDERALIEGAMDLRLRLVREVMTPRLDIVGVEASTPVLDALRLALQEGHSRLPVYEGTLDRITGVLATKDLLPFLLDAGAQGRVQDTLRPVLFLPESGRVNVALDELRRHRTLLAVVVDANGATTGLVTLEDLLEELVGEIQDEYDAEEAPIRLLSAPDAGELVVECDATSSARELGRFLGAELNVSTTLRDSEGVPISSGTSLAELFIERFGRVPRVGDLVRVGQATATRADDERSWSVWLEAAAMSGPRLEMLRARLQEEASVGE